MSLIEHIDRVVEATTPLPKSFDRGEIGLMTYSEFMEYQNPDKKSHPSSAYDHDLFKMNRDTSLNVQWEDPDGYEVWKAKKPGDYVIKKDGRLLAVLHRGTLYYDATANPARLPTAYLPMKHNAEWTLLPIRKKKRVKYALDYIDKVSSRVKVGDFPNVIQNIKTRDGEQLQLRSREPLKKNDGQTMMLFNSDGQVVAYATDEWGASLVSLAREYRGQGLGKLMVKYWMENNPRYTSGGFTPAGKATATRVWQDRVREFLSRGWYSELVRRGRISKKEVDAILDSLGKTGARIRSTSPAPAQKKRDDDPLFMVKDSMFLIYDSRAFDAEPELEALKPLIYAYGFFRNPRPDVTILYRIDYEPEYAETATEVALQMARNEGFPIYIGTEYGADMLEIDRVDVPLEVENDRVRATKDVMNLKALSRKEKAIRRKKDPYRELEYLLIEAAEYKW